MMTIKQFTERLLPWVAHERLTRGMQEAVMVLLAETDLIERGDVQVALGTFASEKPDWAELFDLFHDRDTEFSPSQVQVLNVVLSLAGERAVYAHCFLNDVDHVKAARLLRAIIRANGLQDDLGLMVYVSADVKPLGGQDEVKA